MLPHVANRPLTLVRCPDGAEKQCFYQRHLGMGTSPGDLKTFERLRSSKGRYLYLDSKRGILSAVQENLIRGQGPNTQNELWPWPRIRCGIRPVDA